MRPVSVFRSRTAPRASTRSWLWLGLAGLSALPHGAGAERPKQEEPGFALSSPAFAAQREIPGKYTCEGPDVSPPLTWDGVPEDAQSLVLIMEDPDAPDPAAPLRTFVHWLLLDLSPSLRGLREDLRELPPGALEGLNDQQRTGYTGPCPARGRHRYFFKLFALDTKLKLIKPQRAQLEEAMQGHVLARAELMGTYEKKKKGQPELSRRRTQGKH